MSFSQRSAKRKVLCCLSVGSAGHSSRNLLATRTLATYSSARGPSSGSMASGLGREEFKEIRVTASSWTFLDRTPQEHGADWPEDFLVTQRVPAKFWTKEDTDYLTMVRTGQDGHLFSFL